MHFGLPFGKVVAQPLCICNREAYVDCSDKQVFPPVKCLTVVKDGQDGLLWLGSLVSITDRLREVQYLVFASLILTESCLFSAQPVPGFHQI